MAHETDEEFLDGISPCTRVIDYRGPVDAACARVRRYAPASKADPDTVLRATSQVRQLLHRACIDARRKPRT